MNSKKNIVIILLSTTVLVLSLLYFFALKKIDENNFKDIEVERKYLVDLNNLPQSMNDADTLVMVQTYISFSPEMRVRKVNDLYHFFTMKLPKDKIGLARQEIEFLISPEEYQELLVKQVGNTIYKTRYQIIENGLRIDLDIYSDYLTGLAVAETEFSNIKKSESFTPPKWFGLEVTSDLRYKNANLARYGMPT